MKSKLEHVLEIIQHEPNYETFEYKEFYCVIKRIMHMGGQLNGYVRVPENHPYYGKEFTSDELENIECHGGLTFSGELEGEEETGFFIGFDTAHYQDYLPFLQFALGQRAMELPLPYDEAVYKDINYVRNECRNIVDQLVLVK